VLLANVALVCSVVFQRGGNAAAFTTLLMVIYAIAPKYAVLQRTSLLAMGWTKAVWWKSAILDFLEWLEESCVLYELMEVMTTGFAKPIINRQVISNCVAGFLCFGLAWLLFGPRVNSATPGGATRGTLLKSTSRMQFLSPGRCWDNPFVWKDYQFIGGGYLLSVGKLLAYLAVLLGMSAVALTPSNWFGWTLNEVGPAYFIFMLCALVLEACIYASRVFHDEIRLQTMSSLLMLPRSIPYMGYSKAIGCIMGLFPAVLCFIGSLFLLPNTTPIKQFSSIIDPRIWALIMTFLIFLHLIALLSLFVKWGALPAAFFLMGPISICCPAGNLMFFVASPNSGIQSVWGELPATITVWILTGLVCFVFQMMIAARLQELGTK
jgi:hypothetical protein